jgi:two-component system response regulator RegX3
LRVLLVEDDEAVAESLRRGLIRYGFAVEWVTTAGAALAHEGPYDVVLLDLGLPDADGWSSARTTTPPSRSGCGRSSRGYGR